MTDVDNFRFINVPAGCFFVGRRLQARTADCPRGAVFRLYLTRPAVKRRELDSHQRGGRIRCGLPSIFMVIIFFSERKEEAIFPCCPTTKKARAARYRAPQAPCVARSAAAGGGQQVREIKRHFRFRTFATNTAGSATRTEGVCDFSVLPHNIGPCMCTVASVCRHGRSADGAPHRISFTSRCSETNDISVRRWPCSMPRSGGCKEIITISPCAIGHSPALLLGNCTESTSSMSAGIGASVKSLGGLISVRSRRQKS